MEANSDQTALCEWGLKRRLLLESDGTAGIQVFLVFMSKRLYVGNLPYGVRGSDLDGLFARVGNCVALLMTSSAKSSKSP